jgi:hypothetical protein
LQRWLRLPPRDTILQKKHLRFLVSIILSLSLFRYGNFILSLSVSCLSCFCPYVINDFTAFNQKSLPVTSMSSSTAIFACVISPTIGSSNYPS